MDNATSPVEGFSMEMGRELLQNGTVADALPHFLHFANLTVITKQTVPAMQMAGIVYRLRGEYEESLRFFNRAISLVKDSADLRLKAAVLRDLGATQEAIWLHTGNISMYKEAAASLEQSKETLHLAIKRGGHADNPAYGRLMAELETTRGFIGMLMFHNGSPNGRSEIQIADTYLEKAGEEFEVYQTNNLIRLMRVSSFSRRFDYIDRAFELTSKKSQSPGARKHVKAALFGDRIYRLVAERSRK